jgi:hypothetical protein
MKNYKVVSFIVLFALLGMSCGNSSDINDHSSVAIEYNNGQKWTVNPEMTPYILEAEEILLKYDGSDYKELATQLEGKNQGLINSCTMKGKSHEELHKWLHPHMQLITSLGEAENVEASEGLVEELKASFQTYHKYFK